jgi:hypothetical protein
VKKALFVVSALVLVLSLALQMALPTAVMATGATWYVDSGAGTDASGKGTGPGSTAFKTIQYAINAAAVNDTILVAAGTYDQNITLKDGVKVLGAGAGVTTIDGGGRNASVVTANGVTSATILDGFTVTNNGYSTYGGGMHNYQSSPTVTNCTFSGNWAGSGGGMMNDQSSPTVTNCIFSGNKAGSGGGMYNFISSPTVTNCTFAGNSAFAGGGMYNFRSSSPTVTNCVLWGDGQEIANDENSSPVITYSDIEGGYGGVGNINVDPLFVNSAAGDYHFQLGSPCIDTGSNAAVPLSITTDIEGNPRILGGIVDMGAYEFTPIVVRPRGVGGEVQAINKSNVMTPWLVLVLALIIGGTILVFRRQKRN